MNLQQLLDAVANAPETEIDLSEVDVEEVTASVAVYGNELKAEPPSPERVAKIKNLVAAHAKLEGEKTRRAAIAEEQAAAETSLSALLAPPEEEKPEEPATAAPETAPTLPVAQSVTASLASIGKPASE